MCPMWLFLHQLSSKRKYRYEEEKFMRRISSAKGLEVKGISVQLLSKKKSKQFPTSHASSPLLPPSFLPPHSIATSAFFLLFHTPILHSPLIAPEPSLLPRSQQLCHRNLWKGCSSGAPLVGNQGPGATGYRANESSVLRMCMLT